MTTKFWEGLPKGHIVEKPVRLKALMETCQMTGYELSKASGIDRETINKILAGRLATRDHEAVMICDVFKDVFTGLKPSDLFQFKPGTVLKTKEEFLLNAAKDRRRKPIKSIGRGR